RLKDLRLMTRDPSAPSRARRQEQKANPISIKPLSATPSTKAGGFKKGGFKNAFASAVEEEGVEEESVEVKDTLDLEKGGEGMEGKGEKGGKSESESDDDGLGEERYDPRRPTGCWAGCEGWRGG
ncbi:MAG: hypothetical protein L6R42_011430, partial [Xanthoria sp. 1 TBL-2021]